MPAQIILLATVLVSPWVFGGAHERHQVWFFVAIGAALAYTFVLQLFRRQARQRLPLATLPLLLALACGVLQLVGLPDAMVSAVSPRTAHLRDQLLPSENSPDANLAAGLDVELHAPANSGRQTLSLRPPSTRYDLSLLALGVATFYLAGQLFRSARAQLWLYGCVAVNGAALAFFGLVQRLTWNGQMYWIGPRPGGELLFASFVSRNSAAAYLNMCLAAAFGLALWLMRRKETGAGNAAARQLRQRRDSPSRGIPGRVRDFFAHLNAAKLFGFGLTVLLFGGVLCALSRGAILSTLAAGTVVMLVLVIFSTRRGQAVLVLLAAVLGLGLVGWVGMQDLLEQRMGTLAERGEFESEGGRIALWRDSIQAVPDFWQTGTGLGTFRDVYRLYQHRRAGHWAYRAENLYLEAVIEMGAVGLLLMLATIVLVLWANWKLVSRRGVSAAGFACGVVGLFALLTLAIHSFFDFSLYLSANMMLLAVICGATTSLAASAEVPGRGGNKPRSGPRVSWPVPAVAVLLLAFVAWGWREVNTIAPRSRMLDLVDFSEEPDGATQEQLVQAIERLGNNLADDDADGHYAMAKLWSHLYRLRALEPLRASTPSSVSLETLWDNTDPAALHRRVYQLAGEGQPHDLNALGDARLIRQHLIPALRHLLMARQCCPILGKFHLRLAPLSVVFAGPGADAIHLQRALLVRPGSVTTHAEGGLLDMQAGRRQLAYRRWQRCLTLDPGQFDRILKYASGYLQFEEFVRHVLPQSPAFLIEAAGSHFNTPRLQPKFDMLIYHALRLIDESDLPAVDQFRLRGQAYAVDQRFPEAIREYVFAVREQPGDASLRYDLSRLLLRQGYLKEAREHAAFAARLEPDNVTYQKYLKQVRADL